MGRYRVLAWNGIPAQVKASDDSGRRASRTLPDWFQQEIDRVAMRDGLVGSDEYLAGWQWSEFTTQPGSADDVADAVVDELVASWRMRSDGPRPADQSE
jgi:cvfA/B/C family virulence factor